jgi:hypothetical protein
MIPEDFLDYDALTDNVYRDLAGMVKQNHMFSCHDDGNETIIRLRESNLNEHKVVDHKAVKRTKCFNSVSEFRAHCNSLLLVIKCLGLNPYKAVELWKNYPLKRVPVISSQFIVSQKQSIAARTLDEFP